VRLSFDALPNLFWRRPQADHERVSLKTGQICFICRQTAPGGDDRFAAPRQFVDNPAFPFAKGGFTVMLENFLNRCARSRFDHIIGVQECKMQGIRHQPAHGRFSRPHEANQGEIANLAGTVHIKEIAKIRALGTQILGRAVSDSSSVADLVQHRFAAVDHLHFVVSEIFFRQCLHHFIALIVQSA